MTLGQLCTLVFIACYLSYLAGTRAGREELLEELGARERWEDLG